MTGIRIVVGRTYLDYCGQRHVIGGYVEGHGVGTDDPQVWSKVELNKLKRTTHYHQNTGIATSPGGSPLMRVIR